jgi:hypothetical protein
MTLNFRTIAISASVICFVLGGTWLLAPSLLLEMWGVQYSYPVGFIARRAAALFLGVGVMFVLARDAQPSQTRTALTVGFSVACLALAAIGVFEFATGHAGAGILLAVVVEVGLAVLLLRSTRSASSHASRQA